MSKMFRTHQNTIGNLAIALLFVGGCIFLLTGSWNTSESETAKGCCGGDTTATNCCGSGTTLVAETTGGCCGSTNKVSDSDTYNCNCLETDNVDADCGKCTESNNCSATTKTLGCKTGCSDSCGSPDGFCYEERSDGERPGDTVCNRDSFYNEGVCSGDPNTIDGICFDNDE